MKLINNEIQLLEFIDWLPDLEPHERYFVCVFSRRKYSSDKSIPSQLQLKRIVCRKDQIFRKIKSAEQLTFYYKDKEGNEKVIPQDSLCVYISINPRDNKKAVNKLQKDLIDIVYSDKYDINLINKTYSHIQSSRGTHHFLCHDFDIENREELLKVIKKKNIINLDCLHLIYTRGGVHITVKKEDINWKLYPKWFTNLRKLDGYDRIPTSEDLTPIPGTYQGGFTPQLITNL